MKQGDNLKPIMEKTNKTFKANKIIWAERWIEHFGDKKDYEGIVANQLENGAWECVIELPLVNQTVTAVSTTEIGAMLSGADKAAKLIQEYLVEHPEVKWMPLSKARHWEITTDENGYVMLRLNSNYRKKIGEDLMNISSESLKAVQKAINRIKRINGTDKDLFIQTYDKSLFGNDISDAEACNKAIGWLYENSHIEFDIIGIGAVDKHIIIVGHAYPREEE